jgi:Capsular polysaccharide biosynthesis protein
MELNTTEASIFEIISPLIRRWKMILAGVLTAVIIAFIATNLAPKQYETSMLLQVGSVVDNLLENPNTVTYLINSDAFRQKAASKVGVDVPLKDLQKMIHAEIDTLRPSSLVSVHVVADHPQRAVQLAQAVANGILQRHALFFKQRIELQQNYRKDLEKAITESDSRLDEIRKQLELLQKSRMDSSALLIAHSKLYEEERQILTWKRELRDIEGLLSAPQTAETSIAAAPVSPTKPMKRNLALNLIGAIVLSLFLVSSYILIADHYRKVRVHV